MANSDYNASKARVQIWQSNNSYLLLDSERLIFKSETLNPNLLKNKTADING